MILVDTSIWIDLLSAKPTHSIPAEKLPLLATCPPVIQEVMQGVTNPSVIDQIQSGMTSLSVFADPVPLKLFLSAAEIYRIGRKKGFTIRSSADCLIAAIAKEYKLSIWHRDRDFDQISKYIDINVIRTLIL